MKKLLLLLTALVITVTSVVAESFHYDPHSNMRISANETSPTAVSVEQDSTGITVSYSLGSLFFDESKDLSGCYSVRLQDFGYLEVRMVCNDSISLPMRLLLSKILSPALPTEDSDPDTEALTGIIASSDSVAKLHCIGWRGQELMAGVEIIPVRYDFDSKRFVVL